MLSDTSVTFRTIEALGMATGASLCVLMAILQLRSRVGGGSRMLTVLWLSGLLWTAGCFVKIMLLLAGFSADGQTVRSASTIAWWSTSFSPVVFTAAMINRLPRRPKIAPLWLGVSTAAGFVVLILFVIAGFVPDPPINITNASKVSFWVAMSNFALFGTVAVATRDRRPRPGPKPGARGMGRLWVAFTAIWIVLTLATVLEADSLGMTGTIVGLLSEQWAIPATILVALSLARTHYADVVLKRSLILVLSIVVSATAAWNIPGLGRGMPVVLASLIGAALMLLAPSLYRGLGFLVERVLLRKPDYSAMARGFADEARRTTDHAELTSLAERRIGEALGLTARLAPAAPPGPDAERLSLKGGQALDLAPASRAKALMQAEHTLLDAMADEIARREEGLAFEAERRERESREERLQHAVTQAELKALRAQVDPHFLFNTLNAIADLIATDPDKAEDMTERLAAFFRYTLARQETGLSTLDEELDFMRQYLAIEQVRFGDRLKVEIKMDKGLGDESVPTLILQPLVENALRHGISSKLEGGKVRVTASRNGAGLKLEVLDDGVGFAAKSTPRVGLTNVRERLKAMHGDAAGMSIGKGPGGKGTSIVLSLP